MDQRQFFMEFSVHFLEYLTSVHLQSAMFENSNKDRTSGSTCGR